MDCSAAEVSAAVQLEGVDQESNKGKFIVEVAASVLFGIPPLANAWHTSIVVDGEEYFFSDQGMCYDDKLISHAGSATEKYEVGRTNHSAADMWWAVGEHFRPGTYDLLWKNCNSFSDAALFFLLGKRLDKKYSSLETLGRTSPEIVKRIIYVQNPAAADFNIENIIEAVTEHSKRPHARRQALTRSISAPLPDHVIPHLPRVTKRCKALGDITNEQQQGPGARAKEIENSADEQASKKYIFLPKKLKGVTVLVKENDDTWKATNILLKASTRGLAYRPCKDLSARMASLLEWGDFMKGEDTGDGWVRFETTEVSLKAAMKATSLSGGVREADTSKALPRKFPLPSTTSDLPTTPREREPFSTISPTSSSSGNAAPFLTNKVYPTNKMMPGEELVTPRSNQENQPPSQDAAAEIRRSRSKGPMSRSGSSNNRKSLTTALAAMGGG